MNKIIKSFALVTIIGLATRFLSFIFRIILSRGISSYDLGIYQLTLSVFMILITLTSSGIPLAISRITSDYQAMGRKKDSDSLASTGLIVTFCGAIVISLFIITFSGIIKTLFAESNCYQMLLILLPAFIFSAVYSTLRGSIWGKKRFLEYSLTELIEEIAALATLILLFYVIKPQFDKVFFPAISITVSTIIASFFAVFFYFRTGGHITCTKSQLKPLMETASPITFVRVLSTVSSSILALILPARLVTFGMTKIDAMSTIGLVNGVAFPLLFVPSSLISSLALVMVPEISEKLAKGEKCHSHVKKSIMFSGIISAIVIPIYIILGKEICDFIFNKQEAGIYLMASAVAIFPLCLNQISVAILNSIGGEKYGFTNFLIGVSIALFFVIFGTPHLSIFASIISMFLQPTIIFILNGIRIKKILGMETAEIFKPLMYFLLVIPTSVIGLFIKFLTEDMTIFMQLMITTSIMVIFFIGIAWCFIDVKKEFNFKTKQNN